MGPECKLRPYKLRSRFMTKPQPGGVSGGKTAEKVCPFRAGGGQMISLKQKKLSKLIYFKCKFDANMLLYV